MLLACNQTKSQFALPNEGTRFRHLIDEMPIALCQVDSDGNIYHRNRRFEQLFGYSEDIVPTLAEWWEFAYPDPDYRAWVLATWNSDVEAARINKQDIISREYRVVSINGRELYVQISGITFDDDFLAVFVDNTEKKLAEIELERHRQHLEKLAQYDHLTGLANRTLFNDRIEQAILMATRSRGYFALLYIDLDKFKPVNDTFGHQIGDLLLKQVAERIRSCVRESDTVARIGGDEFVVLLGPINRMLDSKVVAEKVRLALCHPFRIDGNLMEISCSIGLARFPEDGRTPIELSNAADRAMYRAKKNGRNSVAYVGAMDK